MHVNTWHTSEYWTNNFVRVYYFVTLLMYTREYLIALFFSTQRPYWFVSVLSRNPIPFPYLYFPNSIPFSSKNIKIEVEMRFFRPFPSVLMAMRGSERAQSRAAAAANAHGHRTPTGRACVRPAVCWGSHLRSRREGATPREPQDRG